LGNISIPDIKVLIKLSEHFKIIDFNYWLTGEENKCSECERLGQENHDLQIEINTLNKTIDRISKGKIEPIFPELGLALKEDHKQGPSKQ
jgi:hypothetical protein